MKSVTIVEFLKRKEKEIEIPQFNLSEEFIIGESHTYKGPYSQPLHFLCNLQLCPIS
jgi:hypothetical protein